MLKIILKDKKNPKSLYESIIQRLKNTKKEIDSLYLDKEGDIAHIGYDYDSDSSGAIYKYKDELSYKAWMRFIKIKDNCIYFGIVEPLNEVITNYIYYWYHSELMRILLCEFSTDIKNIEISGNLVKGIDIFKN